MKNERYHPMIHGDAMNYYEEAVEQVDKNQRMYFILKHIFNSLSQRYNDEVRDFAHTTFQGDFNSLFRDIALEGEEPELHQVDHDYRTFLKVDNEIYRTLPQFDEYYMSEQQRIVVPGKGAGITHIYSPVGEYGAELSRAVVQSARSLYSLVPLIERDCAEVNLEYNEVLKKGTFFEDANIIMREAAGTVAATFSLAALKKAPGYEDDPVELFQQCIDDNVFTTVATLSPFGLIVPMANHDIGFPTGLVRNEHGRLSLSNKTESFLREERKARGVGKDSPNRTFGCPATPDGIRYVAEIFHKALKFHYNNPQ